MDWVRQRWKLSEGDLSNFEYENRICKVIRLSYDEQKQRKVEHWDLLSDSQWMDWFQRETLIPEDSRNFTASLVLGSRKEDSNYGLSYLPFSRLVFERIYDRFFIHDSLARTIFRNYAVVFSRTYLPIENSLGTCNLVYNCRSSAHWKDDIALSSTYFPSTGRTYAVFYGCNDTSAGKTVMARIANRFIKSSENSFCHPMLSVGIFAEIERSRMRELVLSGKTDLQDTIDALQLHGYGAITKFKSRVDPWLRIYSIRNGLECWVQIVHKMVAHIDELAMPPCETNRRDEFSSAGSRIKDRLGEIHLEYLELIRECNMIIDGMTLSTNMALARDNMSEGKQMKAIAVVTMVFLPATFVATLFSMTLFDLDSSSMWLYPSIAIPLTIIVLGIYVFVVLRPREKWMMRNPDPCHNNEKKRDERLAWLHWV
ncbi:hypothetical protein F4820DRAFT_460948 [Hypoxylon rubiginosum]|uniref:Uncharacterized protein n=1 Tax=Hypoxylon rubiginosum TaxID=110542 RepID=A0ACB9YQL4_9PEZI|nr:hypothetical protein F4820DRAFT_460948 [Hypoxylon rubiginosum]